jgi:dTMP kinase
LGGRRFRAPPPRAQSIGRRRLTLGSRRGFPADPNPPEQGRHANFRAVARFLTFEGLDGSGKSTHLRAAAAWFVARDLPHVVTHEPGGTPLAQAIREVFLDERWGGIDGTVELLLVFASRRQHLIEKIDPELASGRHVLCDRFTDSTRAYQGFGRGVEKSVIDRVDALATGGRRPDVTLLFDLPAADARRRGASRSRRRARSADRLDVETLDFYERVRQGYLELAAAEPERFRIIDSSGDPRRTEKQLFAALESLPGLET